MNREAIDQLQRIIKINKTIYDNKLHEIKRGDKSQSLKYNNLVKPLIENFETAFGLTPPQYLKSLFDSTWSDILDDPKSKFAIKTFSNWGYKINNYVWCTVYLKNDNDNMSYSHSIQIYVLVDHTGAKFGFDYGDKVKSTHKHVNLFRTNKILQQKMLDIINETDADVVDQEAGSPIVELNFDRNQNVIKSIDDFNKWTEKIHIIKNLDKKRQTLYGDTQFMFAKFRDLLIDEPEFFTEENNQTTNLSEESLSNDEDLYSLNNLGDLFIEQDKIDKIVSLLMSKKNIILQGPPGTGKTFIAKKLCSEILNSNNISTIQFHQSYSYEDFIQGYRPTSDGFELRNGVFMNLCEKAKKSPNEKFFLIIDEINRGNLSKIFGELMMLIENDKRGEGYSINLTYSKDSDLFYVPENIYLIGTMNTADRSLSIVDYALRRRFAFVNIEPQFNERFNDFLQKQNLSDNIISKIIDKISSLNEIILGDESLGNGFLIGHSYFCNYKNNDEDSWLNNIFNFEIKPLLEEYWYDDEDSLNNSIEILFGSE